MYVENKDDVLRKYVVLNMVISTIEKVCLVEFFCLIKLVWGFGGDLCLFCFFKELDLTNPKTFRNLAKPMGAQTEDRLAQYKKRYKDWEDPNGK